MAQFEKWFTQDLTQDIGIRHCEAITFTGDNLSNVIGVNLFVDGEPYDGGGDVTATVVLSNGATVSLEDGVLDGNQASVTLTSGCFICPGLIGVYIRLTNGDVKTTVLSAVFTVIESETGSAVDPGTIIPSVQDLIDDIADAVATIPPAYSELLATIAPTFSASTAYSGGSYVWYDSVLYRFTANHAAGAWTGTDAVSVVIGGELNKAVRYDAAQTLTDAQKTTARGNIGTTDEIAFETVTGYVPMGGADGNRNDARGVTVTRVGQRFSFSRTAPSQYGAAVYCLLPYIAGSNANSAATATWCGDATLTLKEGQRYRLKARLVSGTFPADSGRITISARNEVADTLGGGAVINLLTGVMAFDFTFTGQRFAITAFITTEYYSETPIVIDMVLEELPERDVSGSGPVINAEPGCSYVCTETYVNTLNFTPCANGLCSVRFKSGTTPTVLTLPNTVKMPDWWTGVEASRTYEISIADGVYGVVTSWA